MTACPREEVEITGHQPDWQIDNQHLAIIATRRDGVRLSVEVHDQPGSSWGVLYKIHHPPGPRTPARKHRDRRFLPASLLKNLGIPTLDSVMRNCLLDLLLEHDLFTIPDSLQRVTR